MKPSEIFKVHNNYIKIPPLFQSIVKCKTFDMKMSFLGV